VSEITTTGQSIECPTCFGPASEELWKHGLVDAEQRVIQCDSCGLDFWLHCEFIVRYTATPVESTEKKE